MKQRNFRKLATQLIEEFHRSKDGCTCCDIIEDYRFWSRTYLNLARKSSGFLRNIAGLYSCGFQEGEKRSQTT